MNWKNLLLSLLCGSIVLLASCGQKNENIAPKPKGYFRIDMPEQAYQTLDTTLPFTMEISKYAEAVITPKDSGKIWIDLTYPQFAAEIKMTYFPVHNNMRERVVQEREMVEFHYVKADDVEYSVIKDAEAPLYGQIYDIKGKDVATPLQFWMTDSMHHFIRATLYFNFAPNNDSLQPVIDYLREDAMHLINTFDWK